MTQVDIIVLTTIGLAFVLALVWLIVVMARQDRATKQWLSEYNTRKQAFWVQMSQRQRDHHYSMRGASEMEQYASLEARIYELEQQLRNQQDDGK